jgi:hypothetical protein
MRGYIFAVVTICCLANSANAGDKEELLKSYGIFSHAHAVVSRCSYPFANAKDVSLLATARTGMRGQLGKSFGIPENDLSILDRGLSQRATSQSCDGENERFARWFINMMRTQYKELY